MKNLLTKTLIFSITAVFLLSCGILPASAAEKGKYGGILKFNLGKAAGIIGYPPGIRGWNNTYACIPLETFIVNDPKNIRKLAPRLITDWELASDKSHYIMKLRKGVKFHDGTPFNAQAAKWNLDQYKSESKTAVANITSIDVIDNNTIRVNLSKWDNTVLYEFPLIYAISPTAFEKNGKKWAGHNPVGTGPFKMVAFKRKVHMKLEKFKNYYEKGLPYLDGINIVTIMDPMTATASLKRGEIDAWTLVPQVTASEIAQDKKWDISSCYGPYYLINFNSVDPSSPWSKLKMRKALEYAIDRESIAQVTGRGFRDPVWTILYGLDHKKAGTTPRRFNPAKARQLIKEAGYPNGLKIKLFHMAGAENDAAAAFQGMLADVGIKATLTPLAGAAWHGKLFEPIPGSEIVWGFLPGSMTSVLQAAKMNFTKNGPLFQKTKRSEEFYKTLDRAFSQVDVDKGIQLLHQAEKMAYDDAILSPILVTKFVAVNAPHVKDAYWFYANVPRPNLKYAWLDK